MATGDFTIEFLVRFTAVGVNHVIVNKGVDSGNFAYQVWVNTSNQFGFRGAVVGGGSVDLNILGGAAAAGVDYFMSARRSGDVFTLHVNGSLIGTQTISGARYADSGPLCIGAFSSGIAGLYGYLGQVRITPGVVRPTAIPTEPFPDMPSSGRIMPLGEYYFATNYTSEVQVVCVDDASEPLENDLILRTFPV